MDGAQKIEERRPIPSRCALDQLGEDQGLEALPFVARLEGAQERRNLE